MMVVRLFEERNGRAYMKRVMPMAVALLLLAAGAAPAARQQSGTPGKAGGLIGEPLKAVV
jgi:hypothetical protein